MNKEEAIVIYWARILRSMLALCDDDESRGKLVAGTALWLLLDRIVESVDNLDERLGKLS